MNLVDVGSYLCYENVLMKNNFANILTKYLDNLFMISKLNGGHYDVGLCWDMKLEKDRISLIFYEGIKHYESGVGGTYHLAELIFYVDDKGVCDTIRLYADIEELLEFGINAEKRSRMKFQYVTINNEHDLKRALDFVLKKI